LFRELGQPLKVRAQIFAKRRRQLTFRESEQRPIEFPSAVWNDYLVHGLDYATRSASAYPPSKIRLSFG
jgi:hypothetical protein